MVPILCPSCEMLEDAKHDRQERGDKQHGIHLAFRLLPDDSEHDSPS